MRRATSTVTPPMSGSAVVIDSSQRRKLGGWRGVLLPLLLLAGHSVSQAATCTWNGSTGSWQTAANWSCGALPGAADTAVINAGTVTSSASVTAGATTLNGGVLKAGIATNAFGASTSITINGGSLDLATFNQTIGSLAGTGGTVTKSATGTTTLTTGGNNTSTTYGGVIESGSGVLALTKTGSGTLTLSGVNTFTGNLTLSGGTLQLFDTGQLGSGLYAGTVTTSSGTVLRYSSNVDQTLSGAISGTGGLTKDTYAGGYLYLTATNAYTGPTVVTEGLLVIGGGGTTGNLTGTSSVAVGANGTLGFSRTDAFTFNRVVSGTGNVTNYGSGTTTMSGNSTYTGPTNVNDGALKGGIATTAFGVNSAVTIYGGSLDLGGFAQAIGSLSGVGTVTDTGAAATLTTGGANTSTTYDGVVANGTGALALTKTGTGKQTLTGVNTYTGATTISGGTLQIGGAGQLGSGSYAGAIGITTSSSNTLQYSSTATQTLSGVISGVGGLTKDTGTADLILTASDTYSGATSVTAGRLVIGAGSTTGDLTATSGIDTGTAGANGTLVLNRSNAYAFGRSVSGAGGLTQAGSGTTTVSGTLNYSGSTTITAGRLDLAANIPNTASVAVSGGTLGGSGTIGGDVTVAAGGTYEPGTATAATSAQTLSSKSLTLMAASNTNFTLGSTADGSVCNDTGAITGIGSNLQLGGTLTVTTTSGVSGCTPVAIAIGNKYRLFTYTGTVSGTFDLIDLPGGFTGTIDKTSTPGVVYLMVGGTNSISGKVLLDAAGDLNVGATGISGLAISLYNSAGTALTLSPAVTTQSDGSYTIPSSSVSGGINTASIYYVAVAAPATSGVAEQTYATTGTGNLPPGTGEPTYGPLCAGVSASGYAPVLTGVVTDPPRDSSITTNACYGGRRGATADATTSFGVREHITRVKPGSGGVTGVDFGFSYNVVTDTRDVTVTGTTAQGTLRQFITNANATTGRKMRFVPAVAANSTSSNWWKITLSAALPSITGNGTTLDGTAYDNANGTSSGAILTGSAETATTVGVGSDALSIGPIARPQLEVVGVAAAGTFTLGASTGVTIQNFSITGGVHAIHVPTSSVSSLLIQNNMLGYQPNSTLARMTNFALALGGAVGGNSCPSITGVTATVSNNVMTAPSNIVAVCNITGSGIVFSGNFFRANTTLSSINLSGANGGVPSATNNVVFKNNLVANAVGRGILITGTGTGHQLIGNTIQSSTGTAGILVDNSDATVGIPPGDILIQGNVITGGSGAGIALPTTSGKLQRIKITQNSFSANTGNAIDLGANGVTLNGSSNTDPCINANTATSANGGLARPTITSATLSSSTLTVTGTACSTGNYDIEIYKAAAGTGDTGAESPTPKQAGEGKVYLGKVKATGGTFSGQVSALGTGSGTIYTKALSDLSETFSAGDSVTAIAIQTDAGTSLGNTSEFSANVVVAAPMVYWDGPYTTAGGTANGRGGTANWDTGSTNWTTQTGSPNGAWPGGSNVAFFAANPNGTATLTAPASIGGITFSVNGYTIAGSSALTLAATNNPFQVDSGLTATISAPINGITANTLQKTNPGTLVLSGSNGYLGPTTVTGGALILSGNNTTTSATTVATGAKLQIGGTGLLAANATASGNLASTTGVALQASDSILTFNRSDTYSFAPPITGAGQVVQLGAGATTLAAGTTNTYTGATTVSGGALYVNSTNSGTGAVAVNAGTLGGTGSLAGAVTVASGAHYAPGLATAGATVGTLTTGALTLQPGSITDFQLGSTSTSACNDLGVVNGNVVLNGTLNVTLTSGIAGCATPTFGVGSYTLFTYTGPTAPTTTFSPINLPAGFVGSIDVSTAGVVKLVVTQATYWDGPASTPNSVEGGNGTWDSVTATAKNWTTQSGAINDVWPGGTAVATFSVNPSSSSTATLNNPASIGGITFGATGYTVAATGTGALTLAATNNPFQVNTSMAATISAPINGVVANTLEKTGLGMLTLTGSNGYLGPTTVTAGTLVLGSTNASTAATTIGASGILQVGAGGTTGDLASTSGVTDSGVLIFNRNNAYSFAPVISGSGSVTQAGTGATTLAAGTTNTYSGTTTVSAGALYVNSTNSGTGAVNVNAGTLGGTGSLGGAVTVASGAKYAPGISGAAGKLTSASLTLAAGSTTEFDLGAANVVGGTCNDVGVINGPIVLNGTLKVTQTASGACGSPNFGVGVYYLFTYVGATPSSASLSVSVPTGFTGVVDTSVNGQVRLIVSAVQTTFWDGGTVNGTPNNLVDGGSGTWNGTLQNWTTSDGSANYTWLGGTSTATFKGTAGTVTLGSGYTANLGGMDFQTTNYSITGGTLALTQNATLTVGAANTVSATVASPITGAFGITKAGAGTLLLTSSANAYSGTTTVSAGTLSFGNGTTLGNVPTGTSLSIASGALLKFNQPTSSTLSTSNVISGTGSLQISGPGAVTLVQGSSYTGGTTVDAGATLTVTCNNCTPLGTGPLTINGSVVSSAFNAFGPSAPATTQAVTVNTGGSLSLSGATSTHTPPFTLAGGTLTSAGPYTYASLGRYYQDYPVTVTANSTISADTWQPAVSGTFSVDPGKVLTFSSALFPPGGAATYVLTSNTLGTGTGKMVFTNTVVPTYTAALLVTDGILQLGNGVTANAGLLASASTVQLADKGTLTFNKPDNVSFPNTVVNASGSTAGTLTQDGTGTTSLTGANTYTGPTKVNVGTLQIGAGGTVGSIATSSAVTTATGATLAINRSDAVAFSNVIGGSGNFSQVGAGTTTLGGANSYIGTTTVSAGRLDVIGNQAAATGAVLVNAGTLGGYGTLGGAITVASGARYAPGTTAAATAAKTLNSGALTLSSGSNTDFDLGAAGAVGGNCNDLGAVTGNLTLGGTLTVTQTAVGGCAAPAFGAGTYVLFTYTGSLIPSAFSSISLPTGYAGTIDTVSTPGQVKLLVNALSISGTVFEDTNGDLLADGVAGSAANPGIAGRTVRLFDSAGSPVVPTSTTTTSASGAYSFSIPVAGTYYVAVDAPTVNAAGTGGVLGEQTYASAGTGNGGTAGTGTATVANQTAYGSLCVMSGYTDQGATTVNNYANVVANGACYGGRRGLSADGSSSTLNNEEHVTRIVVGSGAVSAVDFGFSFNVVTGVSDSGQGSLRQFITNADAISGANTMRFVPARATNQSNGSNTWWQVSLASNLPVINTASGVTTTVDGTAYSNANGTSALGTNIASLGDTTTKVGLGTSTLTATTGPMLEITAGTPVNFFATTQNGLTLRNLAMYGFANAISASGGTGHLFEKLVIGTRANSFAALAATTNTGIGIALSNGAAGTIQDNRIGYAGTHNIADASSGSWTIQRNEIRGSSQSTASSTDDGINITASGGTKTITGNLITANGERGIDAVPSGSVVVLSITGNTISGNGVDTSSTAANRHGIYVNYAPSTAAVISGNAITGNGAAGVSLGSAARAIKISANGFTANTGNAIDLNDNGVTTNTDACVNTNGSGSANAGLARPTLRYSTLSGTSLSVGATYCATGGNYTIELYKVDTNAASGDGTSPNQAGEGAVYLGSVTAQSGGNLSTGTVTITAGALTASDQLTAIVISESTGNTSEFSANIPAANPTLSLSKTSTGGTGTYTFTVTNADTNLTTPAADSAASITTASAGVAVSYDADASVAGTQPIVISAAGTAVVVTETVPSGTQMTAASCTNGTTTVNAPTLPLNGPSTGSVTIPAANVTAGSSWTCSFTNAVAAIPTLTIRQITSGGVGSFEYLGNNGMPTASPGVIVTTATAGVTVDSSARTLSAPGVATTVTQQAVSGWTLGPASCMDRNSSTTGNPATFGTLSGSTLTIPAANVLGGGDIVCTFSNVYGGYRVAGRVFKDTGTSSGTANDGLQNGGEAGISGVAVKLTNCGSTTYASGTTDGNGDYALSVGSATGSVCVDVGSLTGFVGTGANASATVLPSGSATTVGGTAYTFDRTAGRIAFTLVAGTSYTGLNFGEAANSTLQSDGALTALPGAAATYLHTFIAGTAGTVTFATSAVATPALAGWNQTLYRDTLCDLALTSDDTPITASTTIAVTEGQRVCLVLSQFVPGNAANGAKNDATLTANFVFTNASPALNASFTRHDVTTASNVALALVKMVRNYTLNQAFATTNQAKSGDILEYQITYTNNGPTPISNLVVRDATPSYSTYVASTATCGTLPLSLTGCTVSTAPAGGGTGALVWTFTGTLAGNQQGTVTYRVKVD